MSRKSAESGCWELVLWSSEMATGIRWQPTLAEKTASDLGASSFDRCNNVPFNMKQLEAPSSGKVRVWYRWVASRSTRFKTLWATGPEPTPITSGPAMVRKCLRVKGPSTLTGVQGYSGQVLATATAPSVLVWAESPTKNSLPVKNTSEPHRKAPGDSGSAITWFSSFFSTALMVSTSNFLEVLVGRHMRAMPLTTTARSWVNTDIALDSSGGNSKTSNPIPLKAPTKSACCFLANSMSTGLLSPWSWNYRNALYSHCSEESLFFRELAIYRYFPHRLQGTFSSEPSKVAKIWKLS